MVILFVGPEKRCEEIIDDKKIQEDHEIVKSVDKALKLIHDEDYDKVVLLEGHKFTDLLDDLEDKDTDLLLFDDGQFIELDKKRELNTDDEKVKPEILEYSFESLPSGFALADLEGDLYKVNQAFLDMWGYDSKEEVLGKSVMDFWKNVDSPKRVISTLKEEGEWTGEMRGEKRDGSGLYVETFASLVKDDNDEPLSMIANFLDVTDRKRTKEELKKSKERFQTLISNAQEGIYIRKLDGTITYVNKKFAEIHGYDKDELIGMKSWKLKHPDSREDTEGRKDYNDDIIEEEKSKEIKILTKDGDVRDVLCTNALIESEQGEDEIFGIIHDISERKEAEDRVQFLLTLLRHDLKNKTQVVRGYLQLLDDLDLDDRTQDIVDKALEGIVESQELIQKVGIIKDIDREVEINEVGLQAYLLTAIGNFDSIAEDNNFDIEYDSVDHTVKAGPLLEEMFSNIIENSIKHSEGDFIRVTGEEMDEKIRITFEDNGKGIGDEKKDMVFKRGKKGRGSSGLGMGMYLVKRIAEVYDGCIEIKDSELGGARFDIYLNKA